MSTGISSAIDILKDSGATDGQARSIINSVLLRVRLKRNPAEFSASFHLSESDKDRQDILDLLGERSKGLISNKQTLIDYYTRKRASIKESLEKSNIAEDMEGVTIAASSIQECDLFIQKLATLFPVNARR
jgi:hypothetical protein